MIVAIVATTTGCSLKSCAEDELNPAKRRETVALAKNARQEIAGIKDAAELASRSDVRKAVARAPGEVAELRGTGKVISEGKAQKAANVGTTDLRVGVGEYQEPATVGQPADAKIGGHPVDANSQNGALTGDRSARQATAAVKAAERELTRRLVDGARSEIMARTMGKETRLSDREINKIVSESISSAAKRLDKSRLENRRIKFDLWSGKLEINKTFKVGAVDVSVGAIPVYAVAAVITAGIVACNRSPKPSPDKCLGEAINHAEKAFQVG